MLLVLLACRDSCSAGACSADSLSAAGLRAGIPTQQHLRGANRSCLEETRLLAAQGVCLWSPLLDCEYLFHSICCRAILHLMLPCWICCTALVCESGDMSTRKGVFSWAGSRLPGFANCQSLSCMPLALSHVSSNPPGTTQSVMSRHRQKHLDSATMLGFVWGSCQSCNARCMP